MGMKYNFDEIISRQGTNSLSCDGWKQYIFNLDKNTKFPFDDGDYIRMWVADMDFATPEKINDAIRRRLSRRILGYTILDDEQYFKVLSDWFMKRYQWEIDLTEMVISAGIVPALNNLIGLLTEEGDSVLINTPSYAPFKKAGDYNKRRVYYSNLIDTDGHYTMAFDDIEQQISDPAKKIKVFVFCNPHNPTGRVWTQQELLKIGKLCLERDIWIISDEIHCDLLRCGQQHVPLAKLFPKNDRIITCTAPSKTFNIAGNLMSHIFIPNKGIREEWKYHYTVSLSPLSIAATQAAYEECEDWLEELKVYLDANFFFLKSRLKELLPNARYSIPEATYLAWVNIEDYLPKMPQGSNLTLELAHNGVLIDGGERFISNSDGYIRINVACPRSVLNVGINRISRVLRERI